MAFANTIGTLRVIAFCSASSAGVPLATATSPQREQLLGILAIAVAFAPGRAILQPQIPADAPAAFGQAVEESREAGLAFRILRGKAGQESVLICPSVLGNFMRQNSTA